MKKESLLWKITHYYPNNKETALIIKLAFGTAVLCVGLIGIATLPKIQAGIQASLSATPLPTLESTYTPIPTATPYLTPTITPTPTATSYKSNIVYMREDGQYYGRNQDGCITPPIWGGDATVGAKAIGDPDSDQDGWPIKLESGSGIKSFDSMDQLRSANIGRRWSKACAGK